MELCQPSFIYSDSLRPAAFVSLDVHSPMKHPLPRSSAAKNLRPDGQCPSHASHASHAQPTADGGIFDLFCEISDPSSLATVLIGE